MKEEPQNKDGQAPTRSIGESVDRLEQKKFDQIGTANRERIDDKEQELSSK